MHFNNINCLVSKYRIKLLWKSEQQWRRYHQKNPHMGGFRTNENDCRQK